jgi:hypothetical protein
MLKLLLTIVTGLWNPSAENGFKPAKEPILLFLGLAFLMFFGAVNIWNLLYELGLHQQVVGNRYYGNEFGQFIGVVVTIFSLRVLSFMFPENWYKRRNSNGHHTLNWWQNLAYWGAFAAIVMSPL